MSNLNPIRMNPGKKPGSGPMQFARAALLDQLRAEPGTPPLGKEAPLVLPTPAGYGGEGQTGKQPLQTLQNLGRHGTRTR